MGHFEQQKGGGRVYKVFKIGFGKLELEKAKQLTELSYPSYSPGFTHLISQLSVVITIISKYGRTYNISA